MADELVTSLRVGGIALFTWLAWRVAFESVGVTGSPERMRRNAWVYQRASILVMCFTMVCLASPANLLYANGFISIQTNFLMMSGVTVCAMIYAALLHHALDVINGNRPTTWIACILIALLTLGFGFWKGG